MCLQYTRSDRFDYDPMSHVTCSALCSQSATFDMSYTEFHDLVDAIWDFAIVNADVEHFHPVPRPFEILLEGAGAGPQMDTFLMRLAKRAEDNRIAVGVFRSWGGDMRLGTTMKKMISTPGYDGIYLLPLPGSPDGVASRHLRSPHYPYSPRAHTINPRPVRARYFGHVRSNSTHPLGLQAATCGSHSNPQGQSFRYGCFTSNTSYCADERLIDCVLAYFGMAMNMEDESYETFLEMVLETAQLFNLSLQGDIHHSIAQHLLQMENFVRKCDMGKIWLADAFAVVEQPEDIYTKVMVTHTIAKAQELASRLMALPEGRSYSLNILVLSNKHISQDFNLQTLLSRLADLCKDWEMKASVYSHGFENEPVDFKDPIFWLYYAGTIDEKTWKDEWA
ncbi:hypothetical protein BKA63DRAFT_491044 [Paraphoma chrysanthemicola]|nr:hypothetical protein BKA63DRAFT_491044 [Paraphoma chrysanthemicola]